MNGRTDGRTDGRTLTVLECWRETGARGMLHIESWDPCGIASNSKWRTSRQNSNFSCLFSLSCFFRILIMSLLEILVFGFIAVLCLVLIAFLAFTTYLLHVRRKYSHIPGPKLDNFYLGNVPHIRRERRKGKAFYEIVKDWSHAHGSVFVIWAFHLPFMTAVDPVVAKKALITLNLPKSQNAYKNLHNVFGERAAGRGILTECDHEIWQRKRMMLNPAFHRKYLMNLMPAFNSVCDQFIERIGKFADDDCEVDLAEEFSRVTLDVIGKVAFNIDLNAVQDKNCPFLLANYLVLKGMQESFKDRFWRFNIFMYPFQWKAIKAARFLRDYSRKVIEQRIKDIQEGKNTPNDILQHIVLMIKSNAGVTMEELIDDFITFFIAGQETTSNQLAFTVYEVGKKNEIEKRIVDEVHQVLGKQHFVDYEDLGKLQYIGQTLKESLRLHPPIPGLSRFTHNDIELGGYKIPAGTGVVISEYIIQRSGDVWENPNHFDPDRFSPSETNIPGETYFPFSIGPRTCIGKTLAQFESKVIMARLYQKFEVMLSSPDRKMEYEETLTMRPKNGVWCKVKRRKEENINVLL